MSLREKRSMDRLKLKSIVSIQGNDYSRIFIKKLLILANQLVEYELGLQTHCTMPYLTKSLLALQIPDNSIPFIISCNKGFRAVEAKYHIMLPKYMNWEKYGFEQRTSMCTMDEMLCHLW